MSLFYLSFPCSPKVAMTAQLEFGLRVARQNPGLERLSCGSLWSVTREIDCTICVMTDHMTILNVQDWSARTMQVRNECPSTEL